VAYYGWAGARPAKYAPVNKDLIFKAKDLRTALKRHHYLTLNISTKHFSTPRRGAGASHPPAPF